jgi:hypothetical protein
MLYKGYLLNKFSLFFLFFSFQLSGQSYWSKQLTTNDGLPDNNICSVLKDHSNNLWIGTNNGLALLKNKKIKVFKKKDGLAHNSCWALVQDKKGQIWIGTFGGGLSLYHNRKFRNFTTSHGLPSNKIRRLFLKGDDLFIGTANGFSKININNYKIRNYQIKDKSTIYGINRDFEILSIIEVNHNIVFNTHSHGIYILNNDTVSTLNKRLFSTFSLFKNKNTIYISRNGHVEKGKSILSTDIGSFLEGKTNFTIVKSPNTIFWNYVKINDSIFFGGADGVEYETGGLYEIGKKAIKVNGNYGIKSDKIWTLFYDEITNLLYVGTSGEGLYIVDLDKKIYKKSTGTILDFKKNDFFKNVILSNNGITIEKSSQVINLSTDDLYSIVKNEINKLPEQFQLNCDAKIGKFERKGFVIKSVALDNETIFLNTNYGLLQLFFKNNTLQHSLLVYSIQTYKFDKNSLYYYFPYHSLNFTPNIKNQNVKICFDPYKNKKYPQNIIDIIFTKKSKYFVSRTNGLYVLRGGNNNQFEFPLYYRGMEFSASNLYSNHQIILGTIDGDVFILNDKSKLKLAKLFDKNDIVGNTIYKILSYQKHIIIFTEKGINCIHIATKKSYLIDNEMGLEYKTLNAASLYKSKVLVATDQGAYEIDLQKIIKPNTSNECPIYLDKFLVDTKEVLNKNEFNFDENNIRILVGTPFHLFPKKQLYKYKLVGLKRPYWSNWSESNTIDLPYLPPAKYQLWIQYKDLSMGVTGTKMVNSFVIQRPFWETGYFIFGSIGGIVLIISFYFKRKITKVKARELEKANYEKRIVETKMEALQSQMNPHFVFNSLNVIQNFVLKNDIDNSILYINNFSKLMRKTLENSSEFKIAISDEIKFLKLYVEVQNIRFNNQVNFKTIIFPEFVKYAKIIPPMLIQPLIENCFEHAFDETVASPEIVLEIKKDLNQIIISVTDNGIGFQDKSLIMSQSKALKLVEERIKLLGNDNQIVKERLSNGTCVSFSLLL